MATPRNSNCMRQRSVAGLAAAAALLLAGLSMESAQAHHVPGDDHSGTMLTSSEPPAAPRTTAPKGAVKAMYNTKAEAEAAAPLFNCKGAHAMGSQWMPCSGHNHGSSAGH